MEQLYHLRGPVSEDQLGALAEPWKPFRTWAAVLIRAAAGRVLAAANPRNPVPIRTGDGAE